MIACRCLRVKTRATIDACPGVKTPILRQGYGWQTFSAPHHKHMPRGQNFYFLVYSKVRQIPKGLVATYGQIAALVGSPRASRQVGWALNVLKPGSKVPWQRVINKEGRISIENMRATKDMQAVLLRSEGVEVELREGNFWVDLSRYQWRPDETKKEPPVPGGS